MDHRIEDIMRGSLEDWINLLKQRAGLKMNYLEEHLDDLVEAYQRRNLIVHNGGHVNSIYLSKVAPQCRKDISTGSKINITSEYLHRAINLFEKSFILVAAEFWKQLLPEDTARSGLLIRIAFDHLTAERWPVGESLSYFIRNDKRMPERDQLIGEMNYWQAIKWQGRYSEIRQEVEKADFSAKDQIFQLALHALADRTDAFFKLLPGIIASKKLQPTDIESWPIFREMRKDHRYEQFRAKHLSKKADSTIITTTSSTKLERGKSSSSSATKISGRRGQYRKPPEGRNGGRMS